MISNTSRTSKWAVAACARLMSESSGLPASQIGPFHNRVCRCRRMQTHLKTAYTLDALRNLPRQYATIALPRSSSRRSGVRIGTLFLALSILGLGVTGVGLYNYYNSLKTFPPELRKGLRSALRCKSRQDYVSSHKFFQQAWEKSLELQDQLGILKVTGIAASWSEMLEEAASRADEGNITNARGTAYDILTEAFDWARCKISEKQPAGTDKLEQERMRTIALAVKLSEMAEGQIALDGQTEKQLTWAVEELLRLTGAAQQMKNKPSSGSEDDGILVAELGLPQWITKSDMGATLEALANLYARKGNVEYAMPLYLQSISLLMPPPALKKAEPTVTDRCHAAAIMNNISSLIAAAPSALSKDISQSLQGGAWASKAANIASSTLRETQSLSPLAAEAESCKPVLVVALFNMGMLKLLEGKKEEARKLLEEAREKAKAWKFKDAELRAHEALQTL